MAITARAPRRPRVHGMLIALTVLAGILAVMPVVAAVVAPRSPGSGPHSVLATTPEGLTAVGIRSEELTDLVLLHPIDGNAAAEVARVPHLPGLSSSGSVSPSGRLLALVTPDHGSRTAPLATLHVIDLETGTLRTLAKDLDVRQVPAWSPDGESIVVRRIQTFPDGAATVTFDRIGLDGYSRELGRVTGVAGAFAVGFDPAGRFLAVVVDGRGSTLLVDMAEAVHLSSFVTRDWRLSPSGAELAYIEANTTDGLKYFPRVVRFDGETKGAVAAQAVSGEQALGVAWRPDGALELGMERGQVAGVSAQSATGGFDVPLAFAPDGRALAVQHWSGASFAEAGTMTLEVTGPAGRVVLEGITRFLGWSAR